MEKTPADVGDLADEHFDEAFRYFCRHLVGIAGYWEPIDAQGQPSGPAQTYCYSATVVSVKGVNCLLTAGHAIEELDRNLRKNLIRIGACEICDSFGPAPVSRHPIPMDFESVHKFYAFDEAEGLDFALIHLLQNHQDLMQANGVAAVTEVQCRELDTVDCDSFFMMGFADDDVIRKARRNNDTHYTVSINPTPSMILVERLTALPDDLRQTKYERFVGKVDERAGDIKGMSGGPIVGFSSDEPDRHWIVAIQSSWLPKRRITFGCPLPLIVGELGRSIERCEGK